MLAKGMRFYTMERCMTWEFLTKVILFYRIVWGLALIPLAKSLDIHTYLLGSQSMRFYTTGRSCMIWGHLMEEDSRGLAINSNGQITGSADNGHVGVCVFI